MQTSRALGHRLVLLGRYEEAVAAFRRAYELKADARLLYDIAECYRQVGNVDQALFYYDRYLTDWPEAFDRDQVEKTVAALSAGRVRATGAVPRKRPLMVVDEANKPRPPARPWQRWWFWTGIGVALAAGATAAALSSRPDNGLPRERSRQQEVLLRRAPGVGCSRPRRSRWRAPRAAATATRR